MYKMLTEAITLMKIKFEEWITTISEYKFNEENYMEKYDEVLRMIKGKEREKNEIKEKMLEVIETFKFCYSTEIVLTQHPKEEGKIMTETIKKFLRIPIEEIRKDIQ